MKIKIKSREEIEKTLSGANHKDSPSCYFNRDMFSFCGYVLMAETSKEAAYDCYTESCDWYWHKDWYEVIEDFSEEDCFIIAELDEMLAYFLEVKTL